MLQRFARFLHGRQVLIMLHQIITCVLSFGQGLLVGAVGALEKRMGLLLQHFVLLAQHPANIFTKARGGDSLA